MKKLMKHPTALLLLLLGGAVVLYLLGGFLEKQTGTGDGIQSFAVFIGVIPVLGLFLLHSKEGKRLKKELIDPLIKPKGDELQYWDESGKLRKESDPSRKMEQPKKKERKVIIFMIVALVFAGMVVLALVLTERSGLDSMRTFSMGTELFMDGIGHGDSAEISEGAKLMLSGFLMDLKNILIIAVFVLLAYVVGFVGVRIRKEKKKYQWDDDDEE